MAAPAGKISHTSTFKGRIIHDIGLVIKPELLGVNKKSSKVSTKIAFGTIYIINAKGSDLYKIGVSTCFDRRFKDLNAASPLPLCICLHLECHNPHIIESFIHDSLKSVYFKNEWFQLDESQYQFCLKTMNNAKAKDN